MTVHKLVRFGEEIHECGGDPKVLFKKLESNLKLTEQNEHLECTVQGIKDRIANCLEEERQALSRRDDALEEQKIAEKLLKITNEQLAKMLGTGPEAQKIMDAIEQAKKTLTNVKQVAADTEHYNAPGMWLLSIVLDRPDLFRRYRDLLNQPIPKEYTEKIGQQIMQLAISEIRRHGDLVPKSEYVAASLAADNLKRRQSMVFDLLRNPTRSTPEQRLALLGILIDLGVTAENFEQFRKQLSIPWRKCPAHNTDLKVSLSTSKWTCTWTCTIPGCNYTE